MRAQQNKKIHVTDQELDRWMKEQRRKYRAGLLKPWQIKKLKSVGAIK